MKLPFKLPSGKIADKCPYRSFIIILCIIHIPQLIQFVGWIGNSDALTLTITGLVTGISVYGLWKL